MKKAITNTEDTMQPVGKPANFQRAAVNLNKSPSKVLFYIAKKWQKLKPHLLFSSESE